MGTFLSGGLDSSIITALVQRHLGRTHTVAVGMKGSPDLAATVNAVGLRADGGVDVERVPLAEHRG